MAANKKKTSFLLLCFFIVFRRHGHGSVLPNNTRYRSATKIAQVKSGVKTYTCDSFGRHLSTLLQLPIPRFSWHFLHPCSFRLPLSASHEYPCVVSRSVSMDALEGRENRRKNNKNITLRVIAPVLNPIEVFAKTCHRCTSSI